MKALIKYNLTQDGENQVDVSYRGIINLINDNNIKLSYTDETKTLNTIEIDKEQKQIVVKNKNELIFKIKEDKEIKYKTAYGVIPLKLVTKQIDINDNREYNRLELHLEYDLYQGNNPLVNKLKILVAY
ncbi:MAG: DUF1934 domain-containing protein [Clostridia bacterium]|nr:DUF1934 domain-containing protein [Clostridia bacterium]